MKSFKIMLTLLVVLLMPLDLFASVQGFARLSLIEGDVQIRIDESDDWVPAAVNTPLYEGDSVWAPKGGRTEIQLRDGSVIRLDGKTALDILKVDSDFIQFHVGMGRIYVRTGASRQWSLQFDLPESTVKIDDRGRYRIEIHGDGDEEISVFRGAAYVEGYGDRTRVRTGEMLNLEEFRAEISPVNPQDAWDRWNSDRDARLPKRGAGGERRLPEELVVYEEELSSSGEWVYVREYGYVWRPTAVVVADWAPYRDGRWIYRGGEYVWISYEPWGWAPYHYGRWALVAGFGWCWVPPLRGDVFWAPGYVGWVTTPSHVGWVPLAPGETYYGRGHYGRHSVNVTNVTRITNITINKTTNIYRNASHRNAVTAVDRNSFVAGKGRYGRSTAELFRKDRVVAGRPEPRLDSKAIRMPAIRNVAADKHPPASITRARARELKERFPRVDRGGEPKAARPERQQPAAAVPGAGGNGRDKGAVEQRRTGGRGGEVRQPVAGPASGNVPEVQRTQQSRQPRPAAGRTPEVEKPQPSQPATRHTPEVERTRQSQPAVERKQRGAERREAVGPGRAAEPKVTEPKPVPPLLQQQKREPAATAGDREPKGVDTPERSKAGRDKGELPGRKDAGKQEGKAQERKARAIWKIKPQEEPPKDNK